MENELPKWLSQNTKESNGRKPLIYKTQAEEQADLAPQVDKASSALADF